VDGRVIIDYTKLREAKNGLAVVAAQYEQCTGCNMRIPPQTYNLVVTSPDIIHCPNCRRMLYIEPEPEAAAQAPAGA
jgi:predicted  nucleic acid-binding Zn-ribbon protein